MYLFDFEINNKPYLNILENKYGDIVKDIITKHNYIVQYLLNIIMLNIKNLFVGSEVILIDDDNSLVDAISKIHVIDALELIQEIK